MKRVAITIGGILYCFTQGVASESINLKATLLTTDHQKKLQRLEQLRQKLFPKLRSQYQSPEEVPIADYRLNRDLSQRFPKLYKTPKEVPTTLSEQTLKSSISKTYSKQYPTPQDVTYIVHTSAPKEKLDTTSTPPSQKWKRERLKKALSDFRAKRYKQAHEELALLHEIYPDDAKITMHLAACEMRLNNSKQAISHYETLLTKDPDHLLARLQAGRLHFNHRNFKRAKSHFEHALTHPELPIPAEKKVREYLRAIDKELIRHHYSAVTMLGWQYDTNVNNAIGESNYLITPNYLPGGLKGDKATSDSYLQGMGMLTHTYDFGAVDGYIMRNSFMVFGQKYNEQNQNDLLFASLNSALVHQGKKSMHTVGVNFDTIQIDHKDFLRVAGLYGNYTYASSKVLHLNSAFRLQYKDMQQQSSDEKDARFGELSAGLTYAPNESAFVYNMNFLSSIERADLADNNDRNSYSLNGSITHLTTDTITNTLRLRQTAVRYTKKTPFSAPVVNDLIKRYDNITELTFENTWQFKPLMLIKSNIGYLDNDSNHRAYDYDKYMMGVTWIGMFNLD